MLSSLVVPLALDSAAVLPQSACVLWLGALLAWQQRKLEPGAKL